MLLHYYKSEETSLPREIYIFVPHLSYELNIHIEYGLEVFVRLCCKKEKYIPQRLFLILLS